jgi:hypothetical protein
MNTTNESPALDLVMIEEKPSALQHIPAVPETSPMGLMLAAMRQGANLEQVEKMMALQERWEANEAKKAYDTAFAAFKGEAVVILKNRKVTDGPLKNKTYAELHSVVNAVTPALSRHGLSASWKITRDEPQWLEVTCTVRHSSGHSESVSMGGPPDTGGAKNAIQARASSVSYLSRYTLKAITGLAEQDDDTDGSMGAEAPLSELAQGWIDYALSLDPDSDDFKKAGKDARKALSDVRDMAGLKAFNARVK